MGSESPIQMVTIYTRAWKNAWVQRVQMAFISSVVCVCDLYTSDRNRTNTFPRLYSKVESYDIWHTNYFINMYGPSVISWLHLVQKHSNKKLNCKQKIKIKTEVLSIDSVMRQLIIYRLFLILFYVVRIMLTIVIYVGRSYKIRCFIHFKMLFLLTI